MKIKKIEWKHEQIQVRIEGYERYIPCFDLDEIVNKQDLINKIKAKLIEIDNLPESTSEPEPTPAKATQLIDELKDFEG